MGFSREETQRILDARGAASARFRTDEAFTIADRLEERTAELGDHPLIHYGGETFSYAEVDARANQVAHAARALGIGAGDVCALMMENRPDFFVLWFGMMKLGVTVAFLNTNTRGRALAHALDAVAPKAVVVGAECLSAFAASEANPGRLPLWVWPDPERSDASTPRAPDLDFAAAVSVAPRHAPPREWRDGVLGGATALYIFTSGTTGLPKAALCSHVRWLSAGESMRVITGTRRDDVFYCFLPLYHGAASMSLTSTALAVGGSIALRRKFSASGFWPDVRRYGITACQYIGEVCRYLYAQPEQAGERDHSLRIMIGAGLGRDLWTKFQQRFGIAHIYEGWGSTEANTALTNIDNTPGSCGRVPDWNKTNLRLLRYDPDAEDYVRDADGRPLLCAPGEVGEAVGMILDLPGYGGGRFEGYSSAAATEAKTLRNLFRDGDAWWRSGDLLRYDEEGYCYFVDRIGDTYRWKSENVSTTEVVEALGDLPGLEIANVYGVSVAGHEGRAGMAQLVMQPGAAFDPIRFYKLTEARLPRYAAPLFVRISPQADVTSTFKLRKIDLQRQGYDPAAIAEPLFVRDEAAGSYVPLDTDALRRVGLPPFEGDKL